MCMFVTGVSMLIHLYSIGYMKGRPRLLQVLRLPEPVRLLHAGAGAGQQPAGHLRRLGGRGRLLLLAGVVLVRPGQRRLGRQEGLHLQPGRRRRLPAGHVPDLLQGGHARLPPGLRPQAPAGRRDGHRRRAAAVPGGHREVGPDPPVQLAARRHGGPDPGVGPDPRGHHGDRRGLPAVPDEPGPRALARRHVGHRHHRRGHRLRGRHHRLRPAGHQEGAGLLHRLPDRLHGAGRGIGRLHRGHLPDGLPRLLQGPALPRGRLGHPRPGGRAGPETHGGAAQVAALDLRHLPGRLAGHRRHPAVLRLLVQGRRARPTSSPRARCCGWSACSPPWSPRTT